MFVCFFIGEMTEGWGGGAVAVMLALGWISFEVLTQHLTCTGYTLNTLRFRLRSTFETCRMSS